ncbi:MAG: MFS transporter [Psychrosphaera sp.]|nr:MFS transporter [Psychrosphaera sp.]
MQNMSPNTTGAIAWCWIVQGLERMAYYGFRSFFIFFLIAQTDEGGLALSQADALSAYGEFTMWVYLGSLIGGVVGDLVLGAHKASLLGALIMTAGYFGLTMVDSDNYNSAILLIAIGSGLFKPGILVMLAHQLRQLPERFDSAFSGIYLSINLGAALGPVTIGLIAEQNNWRGGFILSAAVCRAVLVILLALTKRHFASIPWPNVKINDDSSLPIGILVVLFAGILSMLFWFMFELGAGQLYTDYAQQMNTMNHMVNAMVVGIGCIVTIALWSFIKVNPWFKIAASLCLFALGWYVLGNIGDTGIAETLLVVAIFHSLAEVLFSPILLAVIARYGYLPLLGSGFGVFFLVGALANWWAAQLGEVNVDFGLFGHASMLLGLGIFVVTVIFLKLQRNQTSNESVEENQQS